MHTPTYSADVSRTLSMSVDSRPIPPVTRPVGEGASSPHLTHWKAMLCQFYVLCVCKSGHFKETEPTGQRVSNKETNFSWGTGFYEYGSWAFPRPEVSKKTQECNSHPAMKPQDQESWQWAFPSDIQQVPDPGGAKVPAQCEFKGWGVPMSQLRTSQAGGLLSYSAFLFSGGEQSRWGPSAPWGAGCSTLPPDSDVSLSYEPDKCITTKFWPNV